MQQCIYYLLLLSSHRRAEPGGVQAAQHPRFPQVHGKPESEDERLSAQQPAHLAVPGRGGAPGHEIHTAKVRAEQPRGGWVCVGERTTCAGRRSGRLVNIHTS